MAARIKSNSITYTGFANIPAVVLNHPDFIDLSGKAAKLLIDILAQYNGYNNGNLCCSRSIMKKRGWNSNEQLAKAKSELVYRGWILLSKKGGLGIGPDLYAITWQPIDECGGVHDLRPGKIPPRSFKG